MIHKPSITATLLLIIVSATSCLRTNIEADLIITNASIWTANDSLLEAQSMAISADTIIAIGTEDQTRMYEGSHTKTIDMAGKFITPGFIDSHVHLLPGGNSILSVQLRDAATKEDFIQRISDFAKTIESGQWIVEGNWDHTLWGGELPKKEWIDEFTTENPVVIFRLDGHMVLANSLALERAGINASTRDVEGGTIIRIPNGEPTGILKGHSMGKVLDQIPPLTEAGKMKAFNAAMSYFLSNGVTSVHDVDSLSCHDIADKLLKKNELKVRVYSMKPLYRWKEWIDIDFPNNKWLRQGGLKGFVDGSLGSHTAAFHHAYTDAPEDTGLLMHGLDELYNWVSQADKANLQIMVHAIGDKANHEILDIFQRVTQENGQRDRRFRIEHAQHVAPEDIQRFSSLDVIASMQPYHAIDDGRWAEEAIGKERIQTTYAFNSLQTAGATLAFGSDWAVAPASPIMGIYAAVTRRTLDNKNPDGWVPQQKISVDDALLAYTKQAAYASFDEQIKGSLEVGKLADFVVLSEDIRKIDPNLIRETAVLQTYVGGELVFQKQD